MVYHLQHGYLEVKRLQKDGETYDCRVKKPQEGVPSDLALPKQQLLDELNVRFFVNTETEQKLSLTKVKVHESVLEACN